MNRLKHRIVRLERGGLFNHNILWIDRAEDDGRYLDFYGLPHDSIDDVIKMNGLDPEKTTAISWQNHVTPEGVTP
ncbi:hypothetical protein LJB81_04495 [Desulfovibrio sp. OttesenSCG-928-M14]|nr:hypothetical protein [Desulfovibrio sp. OttesenSCG-928-M16]MDL2216969.1 hypothetical protein [Desulfovibrio sp. OttesenSCG-928-M14]